jgi:hypothetical protein
MDTISKLNDIDLAISRLSAENKMLMDLVRCNSSTFELCQNTEIVVRNAQKALAIITVKLRDKRT